MKKGLLTIIILVLVLVNLVLTGIITFAVVPAMKDTTRVVEKISNIIDLETNTKSSGSSDVSVDKLKEYGIEEKLTIALQTGTDGKTHYAVLYTSLYLNTEHADYKKYSDGISDKEAIIKSIITNTVSKYTLEQVRDEQDTVTNDILQQVRALYDSDFVYSVVFSSVTLQ